MNGDELAEKATSRQARYLGRLDVFNEYASHGQHDIGGFFSLIALWNSVKKLDETVKPGAYYAESLKGMADVATIHDVGALLNMMVRIFCGRYVGLFCACVELRLRYRFVCSRVMGTRTRILQGNYSGSETVLRKALRASEGHRGDPVEVAATLDILASALKAQVGVGTSFSTNSTRLVPGSATCPLLACLPASMLAKRSPGISPAPSLLIDYFYDCLPSLALVKVRKNMKRRRHSGCVLYSRRSQRFSFSERCVVPCAFGPLSFCLGPHLSTTVLVC